MESVWSCRNRVDPNSGFIADCANMGRQIALVSGSRVLDYASAEFDPHGFAGSRVLLQRELIGFPESLTPRRLSEGHRRALNIPWGITRWAPYSHLLWSPWFPYFPLLNARKLNSLSTRNNNCATAGVFRGGTVQFSSPFLLYRIQNHVYSSSVKLSSYFSRTGIFLCPSKLSRFSCWRHTRVSTVMIKVKYYREGLFHRSVWMRLIS